MFDQTAKALAILTKPEKLPEVHVTQDIFTPESRLALLQALFNYGIRKKRFEISYEVVTRFLGDLLKGKNLRIFDNLFTSLLDDTSRYESKLAIIHRCLPLMNKKQAGRFMKTMQMILSTDPGYLINNLNPFRVGLMLL